MCCVRQPQHLIHGVSWWVDHVVHSCTDRQPTRLVRLRHPPDTGHCELDVAGVDTGSLGKSSPQSFLPTGRL